MEIDTRNEKMLRSLRINGSHLQKIPEQVKARFGQETFGVKLHAFGGIGFRSEAHKLVLVDGPGGLFKFIAHACWVYDQAVISRSYERVRQPGEESLVIVADFAGLSVHKSRRAENLASENLADALMAQADTHYRDFPVKMTDEITAQPGFVRRAWAWRDDKMGGLVLVLNGGGLFHVVAINANFLLSLPAKLAYSLDEIIRKAVVIVDNNDHGLMVSEIPARSIADAVLSCYECFLIDD